MARRSINGIIGYVVNTHISYQSKHQGVIDTSTYTTKLCAAKTKTEEAISLRYMLRFCKVPVRGETLLIDDNLSLLISTTNPDSPCKKKHIQVAYHYVCECHAAVITKVQKIHMDINPVDPFTKALDKNKFFDNVKCAFR